MCDISGEEVLDPLRTQQERLEVRIDANKKYAKAGTHRTHMPHAPLQVILQSRHIGAHRIQVEVEGPAGERACVFDSELFLTFNTFSLLLPSCLFPGVLASGGCRRLGRGHGLEAFDTL